MVPVWLSLRCPLLLCALLTKSLLATDPPSAARARKNVGRFERLSALAGWEEGPRADPDEQVELRFWVRQTHLHKLEEVLKDVSDPQNPHYGQYLSKREVDELTAPHSRDVATVEAALRDNKFTTQNDGAIISTKVTIFFAERLLGGTFVHYCRKTLRREGDVCELRNPSAVVPSALHDACDIIEPLDQPLEPPVRGPIVGSPLPGPDTEPPLRERIPIAAPAPASLVASASASLMCCPQHWTLRDGIGPACRSCPEQTVVSALRKSSITMQESNKEGHVARALWTPPAATVLLASLVAALVLAAAYAPGMWRMMRLRRCIAQSSTSLLEVIDPPNRLDEVA